MVIVVAVQPTKTETGDTYMQIVSDGFEVDYLSVDNLGEIPDDGKLLVIFHPRTHDQNPDWLPPEDVENLTCFDYPEDAYYVFGKDYNYQIIADIESHIPHRRKNMRWCKIPTEKLKFKSIHAHVAAGIVLWERYIWERYKKLNKNTL